MPAPYTYPQLLDYNAFLRKWSDSFYFHCTTRTVQESKLYPVNAYIELSYLNAFYRYPSLYRKLEEHMPAEEIGDRCREISHKGNIITTHLDLMFYISGRQMLIDMGMLRPSDALDDLAYVLDFTKRLNLAYHRNHAHIAPSDANLRAQVLPERRLQVFAADAFGCQPGDRLHTAVRKFLAQASQYSFLAHCECRLGLNNSGPYKVGADKEMLVRDFVDLAEGDYPWLDGIAGAVSHNNLSFAVVLKDTHVNILDDWGSFEATPAYNHDNMVAVGLYTSDFLSDGYVPVAMDSRDTLADFLESETEILRVATSDLWKEMAAWTRDQMLDAGLLVYYSIPKDLFHIAGIYDQDDWFTVEERAQRFKPLMNDEYARDLLGEMLGYVSLPTQRGSEYVMAKWNNGRSHIFSDIPYTVLVDDEFSSTVGPIRGGSTSLAPKGGTWTTTKGKLDLAEANRLAREFSPFAGQEPYRFLDDAWVKNHYTDPRAEELYRWTQQSSRLLQDRGAGLLHDDINQIRLAAGEPAL